MKARLFRVVTFSCLLVIKSSLSYSQETQQSNEARKKALDAFISATTKASSDPAQAADIPVPGAEITVVLVRHNGVVTTGEEMEIVGLGFEKKRVYKTNDKGEFTLFLNRDQFEKLPDEFHLKFTIKPPTKYHVITNSVISKVRKPASPKLDFVVTYKSASGSGATNKGTFAVNSKAQT